MGKLAVVFFAALALQAVLGGTLPRSFGYEHEEIGDLVRQLTTVSENVYEYFYNTPLERGFSWENREFAQEIEEIIERFEELITKHDEHTRGITYNVLRELREIHSYFNELYSCTDKPTMRKLEVAMAVAIKKVVRYFETFNEIFREGEFDSTHYHEFKMVISKFLYALRKMYEHVNTYKVHNHELDTVSPYKHYRMYESERIPEYHYTQEGIHEIIKELELTLERVHFHNVYMKRAFVHLAREYFHNLREYITPEFEEYYRIFFSIKATMYPAEEIKSHIFAFMKKFVTELPQIPKPAFVTFAKATRVFATRLESLVKVVTPQRHLAIRIQALADFITNVYESLPYHSEKYQYVIHEHAQQLTEILHHFVSKIEHAGIFPEFIITLKKIVMRLEERVGQQTFVVVMQEVTTEVRKFLMWEPEAIDAEMFIGEEYFRILEKLAVLCRKIGFGKDLEAWSIYIKAYANRMSLYLHNDVHTVDINILMKYMNEISEILERQPNPECRKFVLALKELMQEFETEPYMINSFLQKISLELYQFVWSVYEEHQDVPHEVFEVMSVYLYALDKIHYNQRVVKSLVTIKTPAETTLRAFDVVERISKMIAAMVPGFKSTSVAYRVHYFNQILERVIFRLRKISIGHEKHDGLVVEVYENLRKIQYHLEKVLEQPKESDRVNFGVYIKNAVMELEKLGFEQRFQRRPEFTRVFSDFLLGLEYLVNQLQFDIQFIVRHYDIKTMNAQIETVARRISSFLQRIQPKPELKNVLLIQVHATYQAVEDLLFTFNKMRNQPEFSQWYAKYSKIYHELRQVMKMGWEKSIEELCAFLDFHINTIVHDMGRITLFKQETPEYYDIFKYTLVSLSNILARLENVHEYEYYHVIVNTKHFASFLNRISTKLSFKLQNPFDETENIKYELTLQALLFASRLETTATALQVEAKFLPKGLFHIISELRNIGSTPSISVSQLRTMLSKYVLAAYHEIKTFVDNESYVEVNYAMVNYLVAIEKLYFRITSIFTRSHRDQSFSRQFNSIDMHLTYLVQAIEWSYTENKPAYKVLMTEYRRLYNFINAFSSKFNKFAGHFEKFQTIFRQPEQIEFYPSEKHNVDKIEIKLIETLKYFVYEVEEMAWALPQFQEHEESFRTFLDEFLTIIQRMHIKIECAVIVPQTIRHYSQWQIGYYPKSSYISYPEYNRFSTKYDESYYGSFVNYFNKYSKPMYNPSFKSYEYPGKYSKFFENEYEPEYTFQSPANSRYFGVYRPRYSFGQNLENTPVEYKYGKHADNNQLQYGEHFEPFPASYRYSPKGYSNEWKYASSWEHLPKEFKYANKDFDYEYTYGKQFPYFANEYKNELNSFDYKSKYEPYFEATPEAYRFGPYKPTGQYIPEYFGSYLYEHQYQTPKYFHNENLYATKDLPSFLYKIKNIAEEVREELRQAPFNQKFWNREFPVYVHQLVQFVNFVVNHFERENFSEPLMRTQIIQKFNHIKYELQQLIESNVSYQPTQVKYVLVSATEQIIEQFEKIVHLQPYHNVQYFKDMFTQFYKFIQNVKYQIKEKVYGTNFETYRSDIHYKGEKPFYSFHSGSVLPSYRMTEVY